MEKQEFMRKLKGELRWHLSRTELRKVIREYEGYFAVAQTDSTDEATIAELGDPALVATEVLSERQSGIAEVRYNKQRIIAASVLFGISTLVYVICPLLGIWSWTSQSEFGRLFSPPYLLVMLPTALALLLGLGRTDHSERGHTGWLFGMNVATTAVIWVFWYSIFYLPLLTLMHSIDTTTVHWLFWDVPPHTIGPMYTNIITFLSLIVVMFIVAVGRQVVCHQFIYIPLLYLNCATLCGFYEFMIMLKSMDDPAALPAVLGSILVHVGLGVLTSMAAALLHFLRRRRVSV